VQFRPVPALAALVKAFAEDHGLALNEAYKDLAALAVVGLDGRFFALLNQMAAAMGGANAFVHACLHVHAALEGAARLRGTPIHAEPERSLFVLGTVHDFLAGRQLEVQAEGIWFLQQAGAGEGEDEEDSTRPIKSAERQQIKQ
jgi:hypothetical protein